MSRINTEKDLFAILIVFLGIILLIAAGAIWFLQIALPTTMLTMAGGGIVVLTSGFFSLFQSRPKTRPKPKTKAKPKAKPKLKAKPKPRPKKKVHVETAEPPAGPEEFVPEVMYPKPGQKQLPIETIEGIGSIYGKKLRKGGIDFVEDLALSNPKKVARLCDVSDAVAKKWIAMARLTWLDDVSEEDAEALVLAAGITSIEQLAVASANKLYRQVTKAVKEGRVLIPAGYKFTLTMAKKWVASAQKEIPE
jgi:predicted flap endonuclease-1-like 5' DNA nuclease